MFRINHVITMFFQIINFLFIRIMQLENMKIL